jgi:hypothetical protein
MKVQFLQPNVDLEQLGLLPHFLNDRNPLPARQQFNDAYAHGGGWIPFPGHTFDSVTHALKYPEDPKMLPLAMMTLRTERIYFYENAWVCIVQPDGTYEVSRMD